MNHDQQQGLVLLAAYREAGDKASPPTSSAQWSVVLLKTLSLTRLHLLDAMGQKVLVCESRTPPPDGDPHTRYVVHSKGRGDFVILAELLPNSLLADAPQDFLQKLMLYL